MKVKKNVEFQPLKEPTEHSHIFLCNHDIKIGMAVTRIVVATLLEKKSIEGKPMVYAVK